MTHTHLHNASTEDRHWCTAYGRALVNVRRAKIRQHLMGKADVDVSNTVC